MVRYESVGSVEVAVMVATLSCGINLVCRDSGKSTSRKIVRANCIHMVGTAAPASQSRDIWVTFATMYIAYQSFPYFVCSGWCRLGLVTPNDGIHMHLRTLDSITCVTYKPPY